MSTATATQTATVAKHSTTLSTHDDNDASYIPRGPVTSELQFYAAPADGSAPFNYVEQPPEGEPQRNFGDTAQSVEIQDIRGREKDFTLDVDAFQTASGIPSEETEFVDDEHIKRVYYPEVEKLVLDSIPGSHKVTIFDHTIRRAQPNAHRAPVTRVHVDQTARSTEWRVRLHEPEHAEELLQGRYRIVNVWRPLNGPVQSFPLAYASARTTDDADLVPIQHRYPTRTGETAAVRYNPAQQFYYWSGMTDDERLFLKCFDSDETTGVGKRVPHTAFVDPRSPPGARPRESIEVRCLVFG